MISYEPDDTLRLVLGLSSISAYKLGRNLFEINGSAERFVREHRNFDVSEDIIADITARFIKPKDDAKVSVKNDAQRAEYLQMEHITEGDFLALIEMADL
jgi:hypothetical protein